MLIAIYTCYPHENNSVGYSNFPSIKNPLSNWHLDEWQNSSIAQYHDTVLHSKRSLSRNSSEVLLFNHFVPTLADFY